MKILMLLFSLLISSNAMSEGKQLYMQNCTVCHSDDGEGAMPGISDLTENRTWLALENSKLLLSLKNGIKKPGMPMAMPPKGGNSALTDNELQEIISYMRTKFSK